MCSPRSVLTFSPSMNTGAAGFSANRTSWRYLLESGEILTAAQIAGRYGLTVSEMAEDGVMRVMGEGILYGPSGE